MYFCCKHTTTNFEVETILKTQFTKTERSKNVFCNVEAIGSNLSFDNLCGEKAEFIYGKVQADINIIALVQMTVLFILMFMF